MTEKGYQSTVFKPQNTTPSKTEYELNHASKWKTLDMIKSKANKAFLKEILRRSNNTKVNMIESRKHASRDSSHLKFLKGAEWITNRSFWLVHKNMEISRLENYWQVQLANPKKAIIPKAEDY